MTPKKRKRVHSCSICGGSYSTPSQLQRHSRVHSGERPYVCNLCGRRFTRSDHVKQHLKIHSPHRQKNMCRICGSQFYKSQILGSHLRRHDVYQIHLCHQCGEGFQEAEELEKHERLHNIKTDIRPSGEGTDGVPSTSAETQEGEGNWLGCARFCLAQIPSISNKILQTPDRKNENSCEENANATESATPEFNNIEITPKASPEENSESPQISVSPGYSLVSAPSNVPDENTPTEAITSNSNSTIFMVATPPNNVENETVVKTTSTSTSHTTTTSRSASRKAGRPIKAVIKREPVVTTTTTSTSVNEVRAPRCTISLLAASRTSVTRAEVCTRRTISSTTPTPASNAVVLTTPKETTTTTTTSPSSMGTPPFLLNGKRLGRCEYCGIWFEDYAMCMLHNSLHSADDADPFTCRKCLKKLGNRLEFMAHLVWHLDPELP